MTRRGGGLAAVAAMLAAMSGCVERPLPPPMTLMQVIAAVNANNAELPALKARIHTVGGAIVDAKENRYDLGILALYGFMLYAQPDHVYLKLLKATEPAMELRGNEQSYWLCIRGRPARCWVGSFDDGSAGQTGSAPIDPRQLTQLLGVDAIATDLSLRPWPVLRVSEPRERANIVQFLAPVGDRVVLLRELWVDRDSNRPRRVRLFDRDGQVVIESTLGDWRSVAETRSLFPHDVDIRWIVRRPVEGGFIEEPASRLRLLFSSVQVQAKFGPANPLYQLPPPEDAEIVPADRAGASPDPAGPGDTP